jgi:hypothetical protein
MAFSVIATFFKFLAKSPRRKERKGDSGVVDSTGRLDR